MNKFGFEKLEVWILAVDFADIIISITERICNTRHFRIAEQLESASTSVSMNIAEGCGRNSDREMLQFLYYARGSLNETITLMTILKKRGWVNPEEYALIYNKASTISRMLYAFINSQKRKLQP
ncbi:MAG: four helix bundle protein [Bacteroidia bacterium]|nr:four helix bundle protein [Bacteroidia bacterium]